MVASRSVGQSQVTPLVMQDQVQPALRGQPYRATSVTPTTDLTVQSAQRDPPASRIQTAWQCTMIRVTTRGPIICVMQGTRILSVLPAAVCISSRR
jgi:hypothetical protein